MCYVVLPWMYATPTQAIYDYNYNILANVQFVIIIGVGSGFLVRTRGAWRTVCAHLFGASALYTATSLIDQSGGGADTYYTGSWYDLPLMTVFFWYGMAGVIAFQKRNELDAPIDGKAETESEARRETYLGDAVRDGGGTFAADICAICAAHRARHPGGQGFSPDGDTDRVTYLWR